MVEVTILIVSFPYHLTFGGPGLLSIATYSIKFVKIDLGALH